MDSYEVQQHESAQYEMAGDALQGLTDQVFSSLAKATQPMEDVLKTALKYQQALEAAALAGQAFVDSLSKVGLDTACMDILSSQDRV